jgi:hypothetical protein
MKVTICGPNLRDQSKGSFHVHAAGCKDLRNYGRGRLGGEMPWTIEVETRWEVLVDIYGDVATDHAEYGTPKWWEVVEDNGSDTWFAPCTKALPYE